MSHLHYTPKHHHLQLSMVQLRQICQELYMSVAPAECTCRKNIGKCKVSDIAILTMMLFQAEIGIKSQRKFYRIYQLLAGSSQLERSRFNRRCRYLVPLFQLIRAHFNRLDFQELVIIDSFPLLLCHPVRNSRARLLNNFANIGYNASKQMWFYGFKVHMAVTESGYILNYIVTPASVHDSQVAKELLDGIRAPYVLADLGYLSKALKLDLENRGVTLWTPLRSNMDGARQHNNYDILAIRRTIETRFSMLCSEFDIEHPSAKSLSGIQAEIERAILLYNLGFFIN